MDSLLFGQLLWGKEGRGAAWGLLLDRQAPELTNAGLAVGLGLLGLVKGRRQSSVRRQ